MSKEVQSDQMIQRGERLERPSTTVKLPSKIDTSLFQHEKISSNLKLKFNSFLIKTILMTHGALNGVKT